MKSSDLFVDTSGWVCAAIESEPFHAAAGTILQEARRRHRGIITTSYVISEMVPLLQRIGVSRPSILQLVEMVRTSADITVIHVDEQLDEDGWQLLKSRPDKDWSLVDATSFKLMEQVGMREALTTDRHFEQAGFARLLK